MRDRLIFLALLTITSAEKALQHSEVIGADGDIWLHWTPDEDANSVTMRVEARTHGWAAVGFSPSGGMTGADIVLGWVSDGEVHVLDMYAESNGQPILDKHGDVEVLGGFENDTHTTFTFKRPLTSCDTEHDLNIGMDTTHLIWAFHQDDPRNEEAPVYHGSNRGVRSVSLDGSGRFDYPSPGSVESFMVQHNQTALKPVETYYHCSAHRIPDFGEQKIHYTGYRVNLDPQTRPYVHHFVMYACSLPESLHETFEEFLHEHPGAECYGPNMPQPWTLCRSVLIAWAVGGEGDMLPNHVGIPLGHQHGGATYFMLETHYDNPQKHAGLRDSSGIELFFTRTLRPVEAEVASVGHQVSSSHMIPPGQNNFITSGICSSDCTSRFLPEDGIRVHTVLLHSHLAGRNMALRHIRDGKELLPLAHDSSYDFNYQQSRVIRRDVRILPGDSLRLECGYNTEDRASVTMGGFGSREEMCLAFITYYPRTPMVWCTSRLSLAPILRTVGVDKIDLNGLHLPLDTAADLWTHSSQKFANDIRQNAAGRKNITMKELPRGSGATTNATDWFNRAELRALRVPKGLREQPTPLYDFLKHIDWDADSVSHLQTENLEGLMYSFCSDSHFDKKVHYTEFFSGPHKFPKFDKHVEQPSEHCSSVKAHVAGFVDSASGQIHPFPFFTAAVVTTLLLFITY